jgi:hypothetical protein
MAPAAEVTVPFVQPAESQHVVQGLADISL